MARKKSGMILAGVAGLGVLAIAGIAMAGSKKSKATKQPTGDLPENLIVVTNPDAPDTAGPILEAQSSGKFAAIITAGSGTKGAKEGELDAMIGFARAYPELFFVYLKVGGSMVSDDVVAASCLFIDSNDPIVFTQDSVTLDAFKGVTRQAIDCALSGGQSDPLPDIEETPSGPVDKGPNYIQGVPPGNPPGWKNESQLDAAFVNAQGLARAIKVLGFPVADLDALAQLMIDSYKFDPQNDIPVDIVKSVQRAYNTVSRARGMTTDNGKTIPSTLGGLTVDGFFGYRTQAGVLQLIDLFALNEMDEQTLLDYIAQQFDGYPVNEEIALPSIVDGLRAAGVP